MTRKRHFVTIIFVSCIQKTLFGRQAAVAQSVERRLGKAEVTGPTPVSSFIFLPFWGLFFCLDFETIQFIDLIRFHL